MTASFYKKDYHKTQSAVWGRVSITVNNYRDNYESYSCFWLDRDVNTTEENCETQQKIREVINHLIIYSDLRSCESKIREIKNEKIIFIVSGSYGKEIIPRIHNLPQLLRCYVYCSNLEENRKWANGYNKIAEVINETSKLLDELSQIRTILQQLDQENTITVLQKRNQLQESGYANFMWFQLFMETLMRMNRKNDPGEFIRMCKEQYRGNEKEMKEINDFEKNYKDKTPVTWYTADSCFHRLLNKALRTQDFDTLLKLQFFIFDLAKQLKFEYEVQKRKEWLPDYFYVYRGQSLTSEEINLISTFKGCYLSMNAFVSTSRSQTVAESFAANIMNRFYSETQNRESVLFTIRICLSENNQPFADIDQFSCFKDESETLIMLGALFRIENVVQKLNYVNIELSLAKIDDLHIKEMFSHYRSSIGDSTDLLAVSKIFYQMGDYKRAEKYLEQMLSETRILESKTRTELAAALIKQNNLTESRAHLDASLLIAREYSLEDSILGADIYRNFGNLQRRQGDFQKCLKRYTQAENILQKIGVDTSLILSDIYVGIGVSYTELGELKKALKSFEKALDIQKGILPKNHPWIAMTYNNIACIYYKLNDRENSIYYNEKALKIRHKSLPGNHPDIEVSIKNLELAKKLSRTTRKDLYDIDTFSNKN